MLKLRQCMIGTDLKLYTKEQASHSLTLNPKLFDYYFLLSRLLYLLIYATISDSKKAHCTTLLNLWEVQF